MGGQRPFSFALRLWVTCVPSTSRLARVFFYSKRFFSRSAGFFFPRQLWHQSPSPSEPTDAGIRSVRGLVSTKSLKHTDKARPLPLLSSCVGTTGAVHCRGAFTAVLPNFLHCSSSKIGPNRPLRGRRGRLGTLSQQVECGSFERTAVRACIFSIEEMRQGLFPALDDASRR